MKKEPVTIKLDGGKCEFAFDPDVLDDVELLERFAAIQKGDNVDVVGFVRSLVGEEVFAAVKEYYKSAHGRMRVADLTKLVEAVFQHFPKA